MSFCGEVKAELCDIKPSRCCEVAEGYGLLLFAHAFSFREMSLVTESEPVARRYTRVLKNQFAILPSVRTGGTVHKTYRVQVKEPTLCTRVMTAFGYDGTDLLGINEDVFKRPCCFGSFIRGVFLACGKITDPYKNYHAEFVVKDLSLALAFYQLLTDRGLSPKRSMRGNTMLIYFNRAETLEELLTIMGGNTKVFDLIDVQITKTIRNKENRNRNLDMGNINKQVAAFFEQNTAIERLMQSGAFERLPEPLQKAARLRQENPGASLNELCRLSDEPLTRSGLNHRLQKIVAFAHENETPKTDATGE